MSLSRGATDTPRACLAPPWPVRPTSIPETSGAALRGASSAETGAAARLPNMPCLAACTAGTRSRYLQTWGIGRPGIRIPGEFVRRATVRQDGPPTGGSSSPSRCNTGTRESRRCRTPSSPRPIASPSGSRSPQCARQPSGCSTFVVAGVAKAQANSSQPLSAPPAIAAHT